MLTYNGSQWASSNPIVSIVNLTTGVTGTLAMSKGGTGATSFANNGVLIGAGNLPVSTATGSQYQILSSGAGGALGFGAVNLEQSAAVSGVLPTANGGTGVNSTATFPASGIVVTRDDTETLTNKTITTATINRSSTIGGATEINTAGAIASGAATVSGNVTVRGNGTASNKLILNDKGSNNFVAFKAPDSLASSITWELPGADGSSGQVLATNGSGTLSWTSGLAPTGAAGGDLTGAFPNPSWVDVVTAGAYSKVSVDSKGRVTSGSSLVASDIPNLSAGQITSGNLNSAQLPTLGTAGTFAKVTTDDYGRVVAGSTLSASDIPPISAALITSGTLDSALLPTLGTAGTYAKVTTDAYGRVTAGTTLDTSEITSSLGFTPINKAGDTMTGALSLGSSDLISAGNIQMAESKTLALSGNTADPTGLVSGDKGKTWFNTVSNVIKYWDGATTQTLGAVGASVTSLNGQTGATQTFATPGTTGTAPTWSSAANAHTLNIPLASTASVTAGLISYSDFTTFNGKVAGVTSGTGVTVSSTGNIATVNLATAGTAGTYAKVTTDAYGRVSAGTTLVAADLPPHSAALISSGTLSVANGGTGATTASAAFDALSSMTTLGDILYGGASGTGTRLAGNTTATKQFLSGTGNGTLAAAPAWAALAATDIPNLDADKITTGTVTSSLIPWASPGTIGSTTPSTGRFSTLTTSGNVGIGTTSPASMLSVGASSQFQVNSTGNLTSINGVSYSWPASQGGANQVITNNGSGTLTWTTVSAGGSGTGSFSLYIVGTGDGTGTAAGGTLRGTNITGTNLPGANLTIAASNGTGTGGSGAINFQTAPVAATGATANTLATAMTIAPAGNVGIGTTSPAAKLEVSSTTSGFLPPRITSAQRTAISSPPAGLMVWDTTTNSIQVYNGSSWTELKGGDATPTGTIAYFDLASCPTGWSERTDVRGRYIVGMPSGGTRGTGSATGTALSNMENRAVGQHSHSINDPGHSHGTPWYMAHDGGNWWGDYGGGGEYPYNQGTYAATTGISINNAGSVAGTNAPYIQFLVCKKD